MATLETLAQLDFVWSDWVPAYDHPTKVKAKQVNPDTHLAPRLRQATDRVQRDLVIVSPYFVPGEEFTAYLVGLVERGVRVRILTNSLQANDVSLVHAGYMQYRKDLVAGGVELHEFRVDANQLCREGGKLIDDCRAALREAERLRFEHDNMQHRPDDN